MAGTVPTRNARADARRGARTVDIPPAALLAAVTVVLMPFPVVVADFSQREGTYDFQALLLMSDLPLAGLILLRSLDVVRDAWRDKTSPLAVAVLLWIVLAAAFVANPSDRGVLSLLRVLGLLAVAHVLARGSHQSRRIVLGAFLVSVAAQSLLAFGQLLRGSGFGLDELGESDEPFVVFGTWKAPQGTMVHVYLLSGVALLAGTVAGALAATGRRRAELLAVAAVCIAPVGVTFSRAGALGLAAGLAVYAGAGARRSRIWWKVGAVLSVAVLVPALVRAGGWIERNNLPEAAGVTNGRTILLRQAADLIREKPVLGVGPGRYVMALQERGVDPKKTFGVLLPVHNVPMLLGAEAGLAALVVATALLLALARRAWRGGPGAIAFFLCFVPFFLLDHFAYTFHQGLVMAGVWIGAIEWFGDQRERPATTVPATPGS